MIEPMPTTRCCVICSKPFEPTPERQWTCGEEHEDVLKEAAESQLRAKEAPAAAAESESNSGGMSEAEQARVGLEDLLGARASQLAEDDSNAPGLTNDEAIVEHLGVAAALCELAQQVHHPRSRADLAKSATAYLMRAQNRMKR